MTPTIPPGTTSLATLGAKQLAAFLKRNEVKNLMGVVAADVARTSGVAPGKVGEVRGLVMSLRVDPQVMGALKRLLDAGDLTVTPLLQKRLEEILLPADPDLASLGLAEITARSFEANVSLAKRDERGVSRVEGQLTRSLVRDQMSGLRREMQDGIGGRARGHRRPPLRRESRIWAASPTARRGSSATSRRSTPPPPPASQRRSKPEGAPGQRS